MRVETQRQWSDLAIERSTPCLLGLYSLVILLGQALHPDGKIPIQQTAWYSKTQATFSDILASVRRICGMAAAVGAQPLYVEQGDSKDGAIGLLRKSS